MKEPDVYNKDKITLPKTELYVIYTGQNPEDKPDVLSMKDAFFDGEDIDVDCKANLMLSGLVHIRCRHNRLYHHNRIILCRIIIL